MCFKEKRVIHTVGNKAEGSRSGKDTEYPSALTFWRSWVTWRSWVFRAVGRRQIVAGRGVKRRWNTASVVSYFIFFKEAWLRKVRQGKDGNPLVTGPERSRGSLHWYGFYICMLKDGKRKTNVKRKVEMAEKEDTPSEQGSRRNPSDQDTGRGIGPEWKVKRTHRFMWDERREGPMQVGRLYLREREEVEQGAWR